MATVETIFISSMFAIIILIILGFVFSIDILKPKTNTDWGIIGIVILILIILLALGFAPDSVQQSINNINTSKPLW